MIGGFTDPQGTRTGLGALLLGYYDSDGQLVYAGKVGTGFNQQTLHLLHDELSGMVKNRRLRRAGPARDAGCMDQAGWSARSASASGPRPGSCATPGSRDCAGTRARPT